MKTTFKRLCTLAVPFLLASCTNPGSSSSAEVKESSNEPASSVAASLSSSAAANNSSSNAPASSSAKTQYTPVLPELRFTSNVPEEISFATTATKDDLDRPSVAGKLSITNADGSQTEVKATLAQRLKTHEEVEQFLQKCIDATYTVQSVSKKPLKRPMPRTPL